MVVEIACTCEDLPAHDHHMGFGVVDGVYRPIYNPDDIGRVWVDWKQVARALLVEEPGAQSV